MKLIRYEKPELNTPLGGRYDSLIHDPFMGRLLPRFFDWNREFPGWDDFLPTRRLGADMFEDEGAYYIRMEIPGVKKKDLRVELDNAVLTVSYERRAKSNGDGDSSETFSRSISVPDGVDAGKVEAKLEDGILTVKLTKSETRKPRDIKVK